MIRIILFAGIIFGLTFFPLGQNQPQASSAGKREIPEITLKNLAPPYKDYDYFQGVYTFGSPRVGDEAFKDNFDEKMYRFVNNYDIVSRVPPWYPFVHVGELKFIDGDGIIRDTITESELPTNQPRDEAYGQANASQSKKNSFKGFVPASIRDHVPLLYAIYIWNNIIEGR